MTKTAKEFLDDPDHRLAKGYDRKLIESFDDHDGKYGHITVASLIEILECYEPSDRVWIRKKFSPRRGWTIAPIEYLIGRYGHVVLG